MLKTCFCETFNSDLFSVRHRLKTISVYLKEEFGLSSDENLLDLRIILSELIINAIIHGNKMDAAKNVELYVEIEDDMFISTVRDEGEGFDYREVFKSKRSSASERGRGLIMALSLADSFEWNIAGNEITIYKSLKVSDRLPPKRQPETHKSAL